MKKFVFAALLPLLAVCCRPADNEDSLDKLVDSVYARLSCLLFSEEDLRSSMPSPTAVQPFCRPGILARRVEMPWLTSLPARS